MLEVSPFVEPFTRFLSVLSILGTIGFAIGLAMFIYSFTSEKEFKLVSLIAKYILPIGFLLTILGVFLTLYYQYSVGYAPCELCWYQRIFLYPQMFMFGYAWYKKDMKVLPHAFMLSLIGFAIAVYHHILQLGYNIYKPCSTAPFAVDCAKPSFIEYGFVTFPFMAAVLFGWLLLTVGGSLYIKNLSKGV